MAINGPTSAPIESLAAVYANNSALIAASNVRLTTGQRILRNGDDPASIAAATPLKTQTSTLRSGLTNGAHATTLLQVAYDGLSQIRDVLTRLSDYTSTANQAGVTTRQYITLDAQFQSQLATIDTIVASTTYNGANLLDGTASGAGAPIYQLGSTNGSTLTADIPNVTQANLFPLPVSLSNAANANAATTPVSNAQQSIDVAIAKVDAYLARIAAAEDATKHELSGVRNGVSSLLDTDVPSETNQLTRNTLRQDTAAALFAQTFNLSSDLLKLVH